MPTSRVPAAWSPTRSWWKPCWCESAKGGRSRGLQPHNAGPQHLRSDLEFWKPGLEWSRSGAWPWVTWAEELPTAPGLVWNWIQNRPRPHRLALETHRAGLPQPVFTDVNPAPPGAREAGCSRSHGGEGPGLRLGSPDSPAAHGPRWGPTWKVAPRWGLKPGTCSGICLCLCVHVCVPARVCLHVCTCVHAHACACMCMCAGRSGKTPLPV